MQTKQQIQQLLASAGILPDKRLGQHFLIDLNLMRLLIDGADIHDNDIVLEVGCGTGSLTQGLAEKAGKVIAVEFDRTIAKIAQRELTKEKNVEVLQTDILKSKNTISPAVTAALQSARKEFTGRILLVANLPYNVACPVMMNLVTGPLVADGMFVTVQKEVAERMTAQLHSRHYGTLSILLVATGDVKMERILRPTVFWPQPQVDSAMLSFVRKEEKAEQIRDIRILSEVMNLFMQHRRKMLRACTKFAAGRLAEIDNWSQILERCFIDSQKRPEEITPQDYISIANLCTEQLKTLP